MASFITLGNFTHQGITNIKETPDRVKATRELAKSCGVEMKDFYLTMGAYDFALLIDAPSDVAATGFALALGSLGNSRTTTLKAFTESEFGEIVKSLP